MKKRGFISFGILIFALIFLTVGSASANSSGGDGVAVLPVDPVTLFSGHLTVNFNQTTANVGDTVTITVTATNTGLVDWCPVKIYVPLPAGLQYESFVVPNQNLQNYDPCTGILNLYKVGYNGRGQQKTAIITAKVLPEAAGKQLTATAKFDTLVLEGYGVHMENEVASTRSDTFNVAPISTPIICGGSGSSSGRSVIGGNSLTLQFNGTAVGSATAWAWDFNNDGIIDSTKQNPVYTYWTPGNYPVKLKVTRLNGSVEEIITDYVTFMDTEAPTASVSVKSGSYKTNKYVKISMNENGTIYYTLNGSTPTAKSKKYTGPITITSTHTLKFIAVDKSGNKSPVCTEKYTIDKTTPKVTATSPKSRAAGVSRSKVVSVRLSENIIKGIYWSKVYVKNLKTGKKCKTAAWISGNHVYIKTNKKSSYTWYQVYMPVAAVKDCAGNNLAKGYTWKFKTGKY